MDQHNASNAAARAARAPSVLVVDDETGVREVMARWLASGYDVQTAATADEALDRVHDRAPAVALCDIRMPGRDGLWLAHQIRHDAPETAVIMATGVQDAGAAAVTSLRPGVIDYLTKPFGRDRLRESVSKGLEWHMAARESRLWRQTLDGEVDTRRARLHDALDALTIDSDAALDGLLAALTHSDRDAYAHAYRVASLSAIVGNAMQLAPDDLASLERAALMHDVGKLAMPDAVLRKPAPLTAEEIDLVRRHPQIAADLIAGVPFLSRAAELVRDAHERIDGLGYPNGALAADVRLGARIISVADAFDAMTRSRVFRDAITPQEALLELERCAGTQFDADVVAVFKRVVRI